MNDLQSRPNLFSSICYTVHILRILLRTIFFIYLLLLCCRRTAFNVTTGAMVNDFSAATFSLYLRRKPLYYIMNLIVPCWLLSCIAVLTFLLQPNCGERLGLGK